MAILITVLIVFLTTAGQIFLKIGADTSKGVRIINVYVLSGYACFLFTVALSYFLLKAIPMKLFTVIMSVNYITVMIAANIFLDEQITRNRIIGTVLIAFGVLIFLTK